jgi:phenylalanine-4-hydroxylase
LTGWQLHEFLDYPRPRFLLLAEPEKILRHDWLRQMSQLDTWKTRYVSRCFRSVGHVTNTNFTQFMSGLSRIAGKAPEHPMAMELLGRILLGITVEFGMIRDNEERKYTAPILSSHGKPGFAWDLIRAVPFDVMENSIHLTARMFSRQNILPSSPMTNCIIRAEIEFVLGKFLSETGKRSLSA